MRSEARRERSRCSTARRRRDAAIGRFGGPAGTVECNPPLGGRMDSCRRRNDAVGAAMARLGAAVALGVFRSELSEQALAPISAPGGVPHREPLLGAVYKPFDTLWIVTVGCRHWCVQFQSPPVQHASGCVQADDFGFAEAEIVAAFDFESAAGAQPARTARRAASRFARRQRTLRDVSSSSCTYPPFRHSPPSVIPAPSVIPHFPSFLRLPSFLRRQESMRSEARPSRPATSTSQTGSKGWSCSRGWSGALRRSMQGAQLGLTRK